MSGIGLEFDDDRVAWVTIDRPDRMNAIDEPAQAELERIWRSLEADRTIRAVVLTGAGDRAFCAGDDVKSELGQTGLEYWLEARPYGFGNLTLRDTLDVPVIGRVNGHALGGGLELVVGCDLAIASERATFGFVEPRLGRLPLDGGIVSLARHLPMKRAMEVLLTGRRFTAEEALRIGLVNEVVAHEELDDAVRRLLDEILACAPLSVRAIKQIVKRTAHLSIHEARAMRLPALVDVLRSDDQQEGIQAFVERRAPRWKGS